MSRPASRASIIQAIVWKDLREIFRDRLWMIITPLSMLFVVVVFWMMPAKVNETLILGVYPPAFVQVFEAIDEREGDEGDDDGSRSGGLEVVPFDDVGRLAAAVSGTSDGPEGQKITIGVAFPGDMSGKIWSGANAFGEEMTGEQVGPPQVPTEKVTVTVYVDAGIPEGITGAISSVIREIVIGMQAAAAGIDPGEALPVTMPAKETIILGEDRAGRQVPLRQKIRPILAILLLLVETLALAGLVAVEIERRTVTALLVTPARGGDVLAAKALTGTILALGQGLFFLLATGSPGDDWLLLGTLMLLGAVMMSALGLISGAAGRDFMSTLFCGLALVAPLMIPAFAILFPGGASLWVKVLPSYGLCAAMVEVVGYGRGWGHVAPYFGMILAWNGVILGAALFILKRRVESL